MEENIETNNTASETPRKPVFKNIRSSHKARLWIIGILLIIVAILFIVWEKARIFLAVAFFALLAALGLEATKNDYDVGKLIKTGSLEESKVSSDDFGNLLFDLEGNVTTDKTMGKKADDYNCDDFKTQPKAQAFFDKLGGVENDLNRLDGDKDGTACEALPKGN